MLCAFFAPSCARSDEEGIVLGAQSTFYFIGTCHGQESIIKITTLKDEGIEMQWFKGPIEVYTQPDVRVKQGFPDYRTTERGADATLQCSE